MKILVDQITEAPQRLTFEESAEELNDLYGRSRIPDFRFHSPFDVKLLYYRSGRDLFFSGTVGGRLEGSCSRCLEAYGFTIEKEFEFVLTPATRSAERSKELAPDEMGLSSYAEPEVNLSPFVREQVILSLPTRPLCSETCRGLCPGCGANLNREPCACAPAADDRLALFRTLRVVR